MKGLLSRYITPLYVTGRTWTLLSIAAIGFVFAFFYPWLSILPRILTGLTLVLVVLDHLMLFIPREGIRADREMAELESDERALAAARDAAVRGLKGGGG